MHIRTSIAIVIFVALMGLVMITVFKPQERNLSRLSVPAVVPDTVDKLVLDGDETFELLKEGELWVLDDGRLVDPQMIKRALESLGSLSSTELMSSNPEKHAIYEIDEEKGRRVTVFVQDQPMIDFVIGKASTLVGPYVRLADTDDVYLAKRSPVRSYFVFAKDDWQRLKLFDVSLSDVASFALVLEDGNKLKLVQDEGKKWAVNDTSVFPDGFRFDGFKARSIVSRFLNMRAKTILVMSPDPADSGLGVDGNADTYSLSLRSGVTHRLQIGNIDDETKKNYYAQLNEDQPLLIPTNVVDSYQMGLDDFRALNLMEFDSNNVTRLSIRSKNGQRVFEKADGQWAVGKDSVQPTKDFVLNDEKVEHSIRTLSSIGAMSFSENTPAKAWPRKPAFEIAVTLESDEIAALLLGAEVKEGGHTVYYAQGNVDDSTYLLSGHEVKQFTDSGFGQWQ